MIDRSGKILDVNLAWRNFGLQNGFSNVYSCIHSNYLDTLSNSVKAGDQQAEIAMKGIATVLRGECAVFYFEYPCHSPDQLRWFSMRMSALQGDPTRFVVSHHNITQRKLAEQAVEKLAMQDYLTGLGNRRHLQQFLEHEVRIHVRNGTPICLISIDLDHFKTYNDKLGHAAGDACLAKVGQVLQAHARRPHDLAARLGGDEFAVVMGDTSLDAASAIADSILCAIRDLHLKVDSSIAITASLGIASFIPQDMQCQSRLLEAADAALYQAKAAGRNQVACSA